MTLALVCFVRLALFAAMALIVSMVTGERSATESRLAALRVTYDPDVRWLRPLKASDHRMRLR